MEEAEIEERRRNSAGYITIPLAVLRSWIGQDSHYLQWWTFLRSEANWKETDVCYNRQTVHLQARQLIATLGMLVKQWHVSKPTVIRFLQRLENEKFIERQKDSRKSIITILPLGWSDLEVNVDVNVDSPIDNQVDSQAYLQPYPDYKNNKEINKATGGLRTREEAVKNDFDEIIDFFNEQMTGRAIPQVALKTDERKAAIERLMAQDDVDKEKVKQAIKNAAASDFLNGSGAKGWVADFDWIMEPTHFLKVLENFYRNKEVHHNQSQYGTTNGHSDPRRGVEASGTVAYASEYDRPF